MKQEKEQSSRTVTFATLAECAIIGVMVAAFVLALIVSSGAGP